MPINKEMDDKKKLKNERLIEIHDTYRIFRIISFKLRLYFDDFHNIYEKYLCQVFKFTAICQ